MSKLNNSKNTILFSNKNHLAQILAPLIKQHNLTVILTDENTFACCLPLLFEQLPELGNAPIIQIPSGEKNKNLKTLTFIWESLIKLQVNRNSLLINLGGGMITDVGAFAASTFMRGIPFVQMPTTLLAMVDAAVGGKSGINFCELKNIVGSFAMPERIIIVDDFLKTLPLREIKSGYAEMIKHGLINNANHYYKLINTPLQQINITLIQQSVRIKEKIVASDPSEKSLRKLLNFGHTIGHAVESFSLFKHKQPLLHGEAVLIGILVESKIANLISVLSDKEFIKIESHLLPLIIKNAFKPKQIKTIIKHMYHDKKITKVNELNFTLISKIGNGIINQTVNESVVKKALDYYLSIHS